MAQVIFHEHPDQGGTCLSGAMRAYLDRIPLDGWRDLDQVWQSIRSRPFQADRGEWLGTCTPLPPGVQAVWTPPACQNLSSPVDRRCWPPQRSRVWPDAFNCWEATAHFAHAAEVALPWDWAVHVWDKDVSLLSGRVVRHCWPSLLSPRGDHLLVDLESLAPRSYWAKDLGRSFAWVIADPANAEWWENALGAVHVAGNTVLSAFGVKDVGKELEKVEGDHLPDWARVHKDEIDKEKKAGDKPADDKKGDQKITVTDAPKPGSRDADPPPPPPPANGLAPADEPGGGGLLWALAAAVLFA